MDLRAQLPVTDANPSCYNLPMESVSFEELVAQALEDLPDVFAKALNNVEVVVEDWPDSYTMRLVGVRSRYGLLGFYHGVPLTERTTHYGLVSPDKISIYRKPIEAQSRTDDELRAMVRRVVLHELAHHFGIDDDRLHEIGAY
jgi:predicted Zn-dependent protease with MMP-like domain